MPDTILQAVQFGSIIADKEQAFDYWFTKQPFHFKRCLLSSILSQVGSVLKHRNPE
jgi:hypothetical protein